jgi:SAM-dependent methyltransferase
VAIDYTVNGPMFKTLISPPRMPLTTAERAETAKQIQEEHGIDVEAFFPAVLESEILNAICFPHESLLEAYESGCAEPWTSQLVTSLLIASNQRTVLEVGGFTGQTSAWLAMALERLGGGELTVVDIEADRCELITKRLSGLYLKRATTKVVESDILAYIPTLPNKSVGFCWVDGNHEHLHVAQEIAGLWPKMKPGGFIVGHDVFGSTNLQVEFKRFGGYCLDLPRLGPAGGLGVIQIPQ